MDLIQHLKNYTITLEMSTLFWSKYSFDSFSIFDDSLWRSFKFLKDNGELSDEISKIPNLAGGIYVFYIYPNLIQNIHNVIFYIGESQFTKTQNLRKRIKEYLDYTLESENLDRAELRYVFKTWKNHIHCKYLPIISETPNESNNLTLALEKELIGVIRPFCNDISKKTYLKKLRAEGL